MSEVNLEELVMEARSGSGAALEEVVRRLQDRVYRLSLRMLFHTADAEDASQEILIKVITNLHGFRFECPFHLWVMRIAANHLKAARRGRLEQHFCSLEQTQDNIDRAQAKGWFAQPLAAPEPLLEKEMRSLCTQALLLALDRPQRLAFILGVVLEVSSREGGYILDITPAAFRKRLSRARAALARFLQVNCGLFDQANPCTCGQLGAAYARRGWLSPEHPQFTGPLGPTPEQPELEAYMKELDDLGKVSALFRALPDQQDPDQFPRRLGKILGSGRFRIWRDPSLN